MRVLSVTIESLLTLPSLKRARVLAGRQNLDRIVTSISVLEYTKVTPTQHELFDSASFLGGELVITSFCSIADDIDAQCANIHQLADAGELGVILYYVGVIMPRIDQRLIDLSESLGLVLICMPENNPGLRYSEVIYEVMDAIIRDQMSSQSFSLDLLSQISKLPQHLRSVNSTLRVVSDRLRASLVILGNSSRILSTALWPKDQPIPWEHIIRTAAAHIAEEEIFTEEDGLLGWIYQGELLSDPAHSMKLLVFSENVPIDLNLWRQSLEGIRIAVSLWGENHDQINLEELVRSIIQDDPIKMRHLGSIYKIDVVALSDVWILHNNEAGSLLPWLNEIREFISYYPDISICEPYENHILMFSAGVTSLRDADNWAIALTEYCVKKQIPAVLTRCIGLKNTADVKNAYFLNQAHISNAQKVFRTRRFFTLQEITFVSQCQRIADRGEGSFQYYMQLLRTLSSGRDGEDILNTLAAYLLDENSSIVETAAKAFVHKNTIKYRLQKASDLLGYRVGQMPASQELMYALALRRMME